MNTLRISREEKEGVGVQKTLPRKILHLLYLFSITLSNIRIVPNAFGKQNHLDPSLPFNPWLGFFFSYTTQTTILTCKFNKKKVQNLMMRLNSRRVLVTIFHPPQKRVRIRGGCFSHQQITNVCFIELVFIFMKCSLLMNILL